MLDQPLLMRPILKPRPWGGRRLEAYGRPLPGSDPIGESWEVADLPASIPDGRSVVSSGPLAGRTLHDLMQSDRESLLGAAADRDGAFPLLVKLLDAREGLSVQVHPNDVYAAAHPGALLKSEAWYIIDAEPGAIIYKGLRDGVTPEDFRAAIDRDAVADCLHEVPVAAGDCHYLPGGTCHAIGAGLLVAEIQTPSDTTFRVHDWGRSGRELHIDEAMECIDFSGPDAPSPPSPPLVSADGAIVTNPLLSTDHFGLERIDVARGEAVPVVTNGLAEIWMLLAGAGRIETPLGPNFTIEKVSTILMPAAAEGVIVRVTDSAQILRVTLPSPLRDMIA
ncbi:MAG: type I phosphomannose isomerase catalytic subunit [Planctomycetota bacterium]|jgi:mannose-6-phosphate isomerase